MQTSATSCPNLKNAVQSIPVWVFFQKKVPVCFSETYHSTTGIAPLADHGLHGWVRLCGTPDSLLLTHGLLLTTGQRGGRYDPQPVTRSSEWVSEYAFQSAKKEPVAYVIPVHTVPLRALVVITLLLILIDLSVFWFAYNRRRVKRVMWRRWRQFVRWKRCSSSS